MNHLKDRFRAPEVAMKPSINHSANLVCAYAINVCARPRVDELAIDLKQYDQETPYKLYLIYDLENGYYNFHAEVAMKIELRIFY